MNRPESAGADDLRRLLEDAVSDVHPRDGLDEIRARAGSPTEKVVPMNTRWLPISLAAAAAMVLVIGGTLWLTDRDNDPVSGPIDQPSITVPTPGDDPTGDATGDVDPTPAPTAGKAVPVYFVGDTPRGPRLYREFQRVEAERGWDWSLTLSAGGAQQDPDYRTAWPLGTKVLGATATDDLITIDLTRADALHDRPAGMSAADAQLAIEQLIYTAQAAHGKGRLPVRFLLDGEITDQVLGVPTSEPLAAGDELSVLAPVSISTPNEGVTVTAPFEVTGRAAAFEANVPWKLMQGDTVVKEGFATARECCKMSPFSFTVDAPAGAYTLVVTQDDPSGGAEGSGPAQDTRRITIR